MKCELSKMLFLSPYLTNFAKMVWFTRCCKTAAWFTGHTEWVILGGLLLLLVQSFLFRKSLKVADQQRSSNIRQFTGAIKTSSINHKVISKQCDMVAAAAESDCRQTVVAAHFIFQSVVERKECLASLFLLPLICRHHNGTHSCRQRHRQKDRKKDGGQWRSWGGHFARALVAASVLLQLPLFLSVSKWAAVRHQQQQQPVTVCRLAETPVELPAILATLCAHFANSERRHTTILPSQIS